MDIKVIIDYVYQAVVDTRRILTLLLVGFVTISILFLLLEKAKYQTSWIMLLPGTDRSTTINLDSMGEARSAAKNVYGNVSVSPKNTYKEIALSHAVIEYAAEQMQVEPYQFSKPRIKLIDQTPAMQFTLKGHDPEGLKHRAVLYNDALHTVLDRLRKNEIERHYQGIETNLTEAKQRLKTARQEIIEYQAKGGLVSDQQFKLWAQNAELLRTKKVDAHVELSKLEATVTMLLAQLGINYDQASAILSMQSNPKVVSILYTLTQLLAQQVVEHAKLAPKHPKRLLIDREVAALQRELQNLLKPYESLQSIAAQKLHGLLAQDSFELVKQLTTSQASVAGLQGQLQTLETHLKEYDERTVLHTKDAAILADLNRNHQIAEAIFTSALAKLDTGKLDIYATYPLTQLLTEPGHIVKRDRLTSKLMVAALMMMCFLMCLIAVLGRVRKQFVQETS